MNFCPTKKIPRYFLIGLPNCILEVLHGFYKSERYRGINFCIQVGGLPKWGVSAHGRCLPRGVSAWGVSARGVCPGSLCHTPPPSACWDTNLQPSACWDTPPCPVQAGTPRLWTEFLTHTCENGTTLQLLFWTVKSGT